MLKLSQFVIAVTSTVALLWLLPLRTEAIMPPRGATRQNLTVASPAAFQPDSIDYRYVTVAQFRATAAAIGWDWELDRLAAVALCESGRASAGYGPRDVIDTMAESPWGDRGAMQVNRVHAEPGGLIEAMGYQWDDMLTLVPNLRVAWAIRERDGWGQWGCG